jgi:Notch-like protein
VTGKRSGNKSVQSVYINGALSENQQLIADSFQNYFLSIAEKIVSNNNEELKNNNCIDCLHRVFNKLFPNIIFDNTTASEIKKIIMSLKSKNSYGYDEISVMILKISSPFIIAPLNYICNRSTLSGTFPTRLKYSVVKPLFKKGDNKDIRNYWPISLLTSFSKIFEKIIYETFQTYNK